MNIKDFRAFVAELDATHQALTKNFEKAQAAQRKATADCRALRDQLVAFRREFGEHLRIAAGKSVTVAAADTAKAKAKAEEATK